MLIWRLRDRKNDGTGFNSRWRYNFFFAISILLGWIGDPILSKKYQVKTVSLGCTFLFRKLIREKVEELGNMWTYCKDGVLDTKASALKNFLMILWSDFFIKLTDSLDSELSPGSCWDNHCCIAFWQKLF